MTFLGFTRNYFWIPLLLFLTTLPVARLGFAAVETSVEDVTSTGQTVVRGIGALAILLGLGYVAYRLRRLGNPIYASLVIISVFVMWDWAPITSTLPYVVAFSVAAFLIVLYDPESNWIRRRALDLALGIVMGVAFRLLYGYFLPHGKQIYP